MRPEQLTIEGLRSFRSPVTIDFTGRDHLAIIGDTGAGKSSILEAITFALFGRTTFTGHANQEVMNDMSTQMRVVLRFRVAGRTYEVARTLRRANDGSVGGARASLSEFDTEGVPILQVEQVRQVTDKVRDVLGLDADAFLRTVVLPQGQFAQLLVGDDPAKRAAILRQVWRTDDLMRAGERAELALRDLTPLAARVEQALQQTPEDPRDHLQKLRADAQAATESAARSRARAAAAVQARDVLRDSDVRTRAAQRVIDQLNHFDFDVLLTAAEAIAGVATELAERRTQVQRDEHDLRGRLAAVPTDDDGLDRQAIGAARVTLQGLPDVARTVEERAAAARTAAQDVEELDKAVVGLREDVDDLTREVEAHEQLRARLDAEYERAEATLAEVRRTLTRAAQAASDATALEKQASRRAGEAGDLRSTLDELTERVADSQRTTRAAEDAFERARRENAAAAASHGLNVGDACSVCNRPLPDHWRAPAADDLDACREQHDRARQELSSLERSLAVTSDKVGSALEEERRLRAEAADRWAVARNAAASVAPVIGADELDVGALPPPEQFSEARGVPLLAPLVGQVTSARSAVEAHEAEGRQIRERRIHVDANLANAEAAANNARRDAQKSERQAADAVAQLSRMLRSLPPDVRSEIQLPEALTEATAVSLPRLEASLEMLDRRHEELERRAERRGQLRAQLDEVADAVRTIDQRWRDEVVHPSRRLVGTVNDHRDVVAGARERLELSSVDVPPTAVVDERPDAVLAAVDRMRRSHHAVTETTAALIEDMASRAQAARGTLEEVAHELRSTVVDGDVASVGAHVDSVVARAGEVAAEAELDARSAEREADRFALLVEPLVALRSGAGEIDNAHRVLSDLSAALKPGAFPKWLTLRRSRALLIHASRLLEHMSGGRYVFAELSDESAEWRVIDNDSGLARSPASLSGGEKFVTSLALALGMVEMMSRSGGRLESLWLDEGFGSLDRSNLDAAIEALASVASRGRIVAVISHVGAVAEQVDHVLAVTRTATGTRAQWLDLGERTELATSDIDGADALSGLLH